MTPVQGQFWPLGHNHPMAWAAVSLKVATVVDSLIIVAPIVCRGSVFGPCFVMQYLVSFLI